MLSLPGFDLSCPPVVRSGLRMKSFFKITFATFLALLLFTICTLLLLVGIGAGFTRMAAKHEPKIENGSYLVLDLADNITDTPPPSEGEQFINRLFGQDEAESVSLRSLLRAIHAAASDSRIAGLYLHGSVLPVDYGSGYAALKEVREALLAFKTSRKPIVAYLENPTTRDYYLASVADSIYMNPFGEMVMAGLDSEHVFFTGALQKYGIGVQVTRVGKYKSYVEPFILDKMSPEDREQTQQLIGDIWQQVLAGIQDQRKIPVAKIQSLVDTDGLIKAEDAKQSGLITDTAYLPEVIEKLRHATGSEQENSVNTFKQVDLATYIRQKLGKVEASDSRLGNAMDSSPRVAIVYAEGEIEDGDSDAAGVVASGRFGPELRRLRQDPHVKAIVLRVNSPGGGVQASEVIQHELLLAHKAGKPLIVSMGTVAASGGYWITTAADRIFAEPTTITGSIGVLGLIPNIQQIANNNGVTFDNVKTGQYADLFSLSRPKTPAEIGLVQNMVDDDYQKFIQRVATARKLSPDRVNEIAQGRVWAGEDAIKIGLVDEMGGLERALAYAKSKAGLPDSVKVVEFPAPRELAEEIAMAFSNQQRPVALLRRLGVAKSGPLAREASQMQGMLDTLGRLNDPLGVYARLPFDLTLN
jgi:protease-4